MRALLDTVILIDYIKGVSDAEQVVLECQELAISIVTWIEVITRAKPDEEAALRFLLQQFIVFPLSTEIAEQTARVRRQLRIKLSDAMILATAQVEAYVLLTRNTRDFSEGQLGFVSLIGCSTEPSLKRRSLRFPW